MDILRKKLSRKKILPLHVNETNLSNKNYCRHLKQTCYKEPKPRFFVQYRENITENFASRVKKLCDIQMIFKTSKLRTCLPTLKSSFEKNLKSHVIYTSIGNGWSSIYVGQTSRHVTSRTSEH